MKKIKQIIAGAALLGLASSSLVFADGFAPGEGLYVGGFIGSATGMVQPKVISDSEQAEDTSGTFDTVDGGLGMMGIEGGAYGGYGYKMGDFYAGLEGESAWGDVAFKMTSNTTIQLDACGENCAAAALDGITEIKATKEWTSGLFGRVGFYLNPTSLLSFKGGVLVSKFEASYNGNNSQTDTYYGGGPSFGVDLESSITAIDPNLSVRIGAVYTDYLTAPVSGIGSVNGPGTSDVDGEVTGEALSARVGIQYSFFDLGNMGSLF